MSQPDENQPHKSEGLDNPVLLELDSLRTLVEAQQRIIDEQRMRIAKLAQGHALQSAPIESEIIEILDQIPALKQVGSFDTLIQQLRDIEVLDQQTPLVVEVLSALGTCARGQNQPIVDIANLILEALQGKQVTKDSSRPLIGAIRQFEESTGCSLVGDHGSITLTAREDRRYKHILFSVKQRGVSSSERYQTTATKFSSYKFEWSEPSVVNSSKKEKSE